MGMSEGGAKSDSRLVFDVDDLPDPAFSVTLNRRIVTWNAAAERFFSLRTAEVIGRYCSDVVLQRPGLRNTPCAFCSMAMMSRKRDVALSGSRRDVSHMDTAPTIGFRTFAARSTTGEVQLVHLLTTAQTSSQADAAGNDLPHKTDEHALPDMPPALLTPREREVLRLLADGLTTTEIADQLSISRITARNHVTHVMDKLEVKSRLRAVVVATQKGLL